MTKSQMVEAVAKLAAFDIDNDDAQAIALEVIVSFGFIGKDAGAHRRAAGFLHNCLGRYLWTWETLGCEPPGLRPSWDAIDAWLQTGVMTADFVNHCVPITPMRDGEPVSDCDEPALSDLANACSRLAYFCLTRKPVDAAIVLSCLFWADAEGLQADDRLGLLDWLSNPGLNLAWPQDTNE